MKTLLIAFAIIAALASSAKAESRTQCASEITLLQQEANNLQDRWKLGEVSNTDTSNADLNLISKRLSCGKILIDDFCAKAPALAKVNVDGMEEEARIGQRTSTEVMTAKQRQIDITSLCN